MSGNLLCPAQLRHPSTAVISPHVCAGRKPHPITIAQVLNHAPPSTDALEATEKPPLGAFCLQHFTTNDKLPAGSRATLSGGGRSRGEGGGTFSGEGVLGGGDVLGGGRGRSVVPCLSSAAAAADQPHLVPCCRGHFITLQDWIRIADLLQTTLAADIICMLMSSYVWRGNGAGGGGGMGRGRRRGLVLEVWYPPGYHRREYSIFIQLDEDKILRTAEAVISSTMSGMHQCHSTLLLILFRLKCNTELPSKVAHSAFVPDISTALEPQRTCRLLFRKQIPDRISVHCLSF